MLGLPPLAPTVGVRTEVRLPRDYYVRVGGNDYSVDPQMIARMVNVHADLSAVTVTGGGRVVATHPRCWATGQTITDPAHVATARRLREAILQPAAATGDTLERDLADYDTAFGVDLNVDGQVA